EVVGRAKPWVFQHLISAATGTSFQSRLHVPYLPHGNAEPLGNCCVTALLKQQLMRGLLMGWNTGYAAIFQRFDPVRQSRPEQGGKQERRGYRPAFADAVIRIA